MLAIEFLRYADRLAQNSALGPAEYRSAGSRAYYAAHHSARAFLRAVGLEAPDSHGAVWNALLSSQDVDVGRAGSELANLHADRRKADYDLGNRSCETQQAAALAVLKATDILAKLTTCLADAQRQADVARSLRAWVGKLPGAGGFKILP
jgi:uncharacterized protein (UPF0332 family)